MKIFRLSSWEGQAGGAQLYIKTVNSYLEKDGHQTFTVNIVTENPDPEFVTGQIIKKKKSVIQNTKLNLFPNDAFIDRIFSYFSDFSPDIVTIHSYGSPFPQIGEFIRRVKVPVIFNTHDSLLVCPVNTLTKPGSVKCEGGVEPRCFFTGCKVGVKLSYDLVKRKYFDKYIQDRIKAFICPSRSLADYLHAQGYRPAIHLPSFVHDPEHIPDNIIRDQLRIGYIGRLESWKGVQFLLEAFQKMLKEFDSAELLIAGRGPYERILTEQSQSLGISDKVKFLGNVTGQAKEDFYSLANIMVVPSATWENHPLVAIEAQLRKRPVVGTDFGGIKEIVKDGATGRIVPIANSDALSSSILDLAKNPDQIIKFGEAGRKRSLERFTPEPHIKMVLKVYEKVLKGDLLDSPMEVFTD